MASEMRWVKASNIDEAAEVWPIGYTENALGRSVATPAAASSAMPTRPSVPSSKSRPISVGPCGTRRGGENVGSGCAGSGAQSLRALSTSMKPVRSVSEGWPGEVGDGEHLVAQ